MSDAGDMDPTDIDASIKTELRSGGFLEVSVFRVVSSKQR
jgi:hypothetical protein